MNGEQHLFQIPVEGIFHLYHGFTTVGDEYVEKVLGEANGPDDDRPRPAKIEAVLDGGPPVMIWFHPDPRLPENSRARQILADVFGWHMIFHGTVLLLGLSEEQVADTIRDYG
jgi:hypothetical protein